VLGNREPELKEDGNVSFNSLLKVVSLQQQKTDREKMLQSALKQSICKPTHFPS